MVLEELSDKTTQKKLEAENISLKREIFTLHQILNSLDANIYWKDKNLTITGTNTAHLKALGYTQPSELLGKKDTEIENLSPFAINTNKNDNEIIKSGKSLKFREQQHLFANKTNSIHDVKTYLSQKSPLKDEKGNIVGLVGVSIDITDSVTLEEEQKKRIKLRQDLINAFSNDVTIPLGAMENYIHILREALNKNNISIDNVDGDSLDDFLKRFNHTVKNIQDIASDMRDIAKKDIFSQEDKLNSVFEIRELVNKEFGMLENCIRKTQEINAILKIDSSMPERIQSDDIKIRQILRALLVNALKNTSRGGNVSLEVSVEPTHNDDGTLKIILQNTQSSITKQNQENLYDFITYTGSNKEFARISVGLHLAKNNINDLDGTINFESTPDKNNKFHVAIPIKIFKFQSKQ